MLRNFSFVVLTLLVLNVSAQTQGPSRKKSSTESRQTGSPTSVQPYFPEKDYAPESEKKVRSGKVKEQPITYNARERFYQRMEAVARQRRKNERLMEKPQYSDPMYFGHKRPPKKRPPEKMKYCKVCGIKH
mgnify:CR=1 FL=1|jgi:hypothetical protein